MRSQPPGTEPSVFARRALPPVGDKQFLLWLIACGLTLGIYQGKASAGDHPVPAESPDLASRVSVVFAAQCAECHGPDLKKPRGKLGYLQDLQRLAANRHLVVPFAPEQSELWLLVRDGEMPPAEARAGPLSGEQKEVIYAWIASGASSAPPEPSPDAERSPVPSATDTQSQRLGTPAAMRLLGWLGKFHVLAVHFPIGLLLAAALAELGAACRGSRCPGPAVRFCILLGASGAVAAAVLGWLHANVGGYGAGSPRTLDLHRWFGTLTGVWAVGLVLLSERDVRRQQRSWLFRIALGIGALLVIAAGHFGGIMSHGDDFFNW
jgi:mono/diheme cytochrome c family protein/uncharacterized membrane protein